MNKTKIILVSGGTRSGKSEYAEYLAELESYVVGYIATAQALDEEMKDRIFKHQIRRPDAWKTFEAPFDVHEVILNNCKEYNVFLLDCITLYISNMMFIDNNIEGWDKSYPIDIMQNKILQKIELLIKAARDTNSSLIIVTSEVGLGLVPSDSVSRAYRDIIGKVNQYLASEADEVYLNVMGLSLKLK